ncbi:DUF1236 domain-containing protein [Microvirga makkahensis]|uniref:DUF1236 domain-containing protein n=1 Tax=Microvirga makkahensis TaxID=1128670 RepID=A0A7X3MNU1_9HYPH|nr:DUF1236 domain-containing protein [Microvirga makkahensis]MXQ10418.1 DUF1236 domain-containing protein [Microvirga makkahensis]
MRMRLVLIVVVPLLGAVAAFEGAGTAPQTSSARMAYAQAGTLTGAVAAVRKIRLHLSADQSTRTWSEPSPEDRDMSRLGVGEVLPEGAELYPVPQHESYRYAIVQGHRLIVDAASRQIVYIIR